MISWLRRGVLLGLVLGAAGCVVYEDEVYYAPTGLDKVENYDGGIPPSKADTAVKKLPGLKDFSVKGFVEEDGRVLVRVFALPEKGKSTAFRDDLAVIRSGKFRQEVRLAWNNTRIPRPYTAPVDQFSYADLYLPASLQDVERFSVELPAHESSPERFRVDFERQRRQRLITVPVQ
ncbi:hypothetical protein [Luteolibacter marinus]|uniref:hypothetical protein n=1 Tax=Luteolibacter marinus TaxID=2776705 RepID=UPI00186949CB|nr:hypothetical protein [Luteolibacter marinus]